MNTRALVLLTCLTWSSASVAFAEATVIVELKAADGASADGTVELSKGELKHRCTTAKGRCEIKAVAGGMYTVQVTQPGQPSPKPKSVMIPPSGEVKLIVNAN
jgi:hypothetical protein